MGRGFKKGSGKFGMAGGPLSRRKVYESGDTSFVKSDTASHQNDEVVYVSVSKLDKAWQKDGEAFYIPPGGGGGEIGGRRQGFREFRKNNPDTPVEMSRVYVNEKGVASFGDGRHRFSVMRDEGKRVIPVTTSRGAAAERLKKVAGAKGYN